MEFDTVTSQIVTIEQKHIYVCIMYACVFQFEVRHCFAVCFWAGEDSIYQLFESLLHWHRGWGEGDLYQLTHVDAVWELSRRHGNGNHRNAANAYLHTMSYLQYFDVLWLFRT